MMIKKQVCIKCQNKIFERNVLNKIALTMVNSI